VVTVYYRDGEVRVTDRAIEVGGRMFPTAELSYVWHQRGRPTAQTASRRLVRFGLIAALTLPVVVAAVLVAGLVVDGLPSQIGVAVVLTVVGVLLLLLFAPLLEFPMMALERSYDRGTSVREIWVRWQHHDLVILRTSDAARFGKIYRAIQRAVESDER
jgi:hypothetical protein